MKNKNNTNPFFRLFGMVMILVFAAVIAGIGLFYYMFAIPEPEGLSLASWPNRFTDNFSVWLEEEENELKVKDKGIEYLDQYGLWLQILDEKGEEVFSYHKPDGYPNYYSASELISCSVSNTKNETTIFTGSYKSTRQTYAYMIGFPYRIGKHMIYYNGETVSRLSPIFRTGIIGIMIVVFLSVLTYGFWLSKHLGKITNSIREISLRTYIPLTEKGLFGSIYTALNEMDAEIRHSDQLQKDTERVRKEWITNITHDLKTPLSPIKGYAELLTENPVPESNIVQEYGEIILKNAGYTEKLINDLKLIYQFEAGVIPLELQKVHLIRYIKELVIEIINNPAFSNHRIEFENTTEDILLYLDSKLFRRAIENLIINAFTHNPPDTQITICIEKRKPNRAQIVVQDNGIGISKEEQLKLFERYYRGTNTKEKPEGSGLGLAIAKQIITLHGGEIIVRSNPKEGTTFIISLPLENKEFKMKLK